MTESISEIQNYWGNVSIGFPPRKIWADRLLLSPKFSPMVSLHRLLIKQRRPILFKLLSIVGLTQLSLVEVVPTYRRSFCTLASSLPASRALCRRRCVGGGAPVNFGRRRRAAGYNNL